MRILLSGSSGLVGTALRSALAARGDQVVRLVRAGGGGEDTIAWDPAAGTIAVEALGGFDAVVHLGGENIADGRWTAAKKQRIRASRIDSTQLLARALAGQTEPPSVFLCASAIGYYGDRGDEVLDEDTTAGSGFLAEVCGEWEDATAAASDAGIRVVNLRFSMILSGEGGALAKMLTPFRLGAGGVIGDGNQYWSWIAIEDVVGAIVHAIDHADLSGPVNVTSPEPPTCRVFVKTLGRVLGRPAVVPMPAFAARLAMGPMADEAILASARVVPKKLLASGYRFRYADLEAALRAAVTAPPAADRR